MDRLATQRHASPCNHEATLQRNIRVERVKNRRREQAAGWNEFSLQRSLVCDARRRNPVLARRYLATCQKSGREIDDPRLSSKPTSTSNWRFYEKRRILASGELLTEKEKKKKRKQKRRKKKENVKACKRCNSIPWWLGNNLKIAYACGKLLPREICISLTRSLFTSQMSVARIFGFFAN